MIDTVVAKGPQGQGSVICDIDADRRFQSAEPISGCAS